VHVWGISGLLSLGIRVVLTVPTPEIPALSQSIYLVTL